MFFLFFFNDTATTEIYTLSLHDALPIFGVRRDRRELVSARQPRPVRPDGPVPVQFRLRLLEAAPVETEQEQDQDRKSTRLNSSHVRISYAVFCLKKKNTKRAEQLIRQST